MDPALANQVVGLLLNLPGVLVHVIGPGAEAFVSALCSLSPNHQPFIHRKNNDQTLQMILSAGKPAVLVGTEPGILEKPELRRQAQARIAAFHFPAADQNWTHLGYEAFTSFQRHTETGFPLIETRTAEMKALAATLYGPNLDAYISSFRRLSAPKSDDWSFETELVVNKSVMRSGYAPWCRTHNRLLEYTPSDKDYLDRPLKRALDAAGHTIAGLKVRHPYHRGKYKHVRVIRGLRLHRGAGIAKKSSPVKVTTANQPVLKTKPMPVVLSRHRITMLEPLPDEDTDLEDSI